MLIQAILYVYVEEEVCFFPKVLLRQKCWIYQITQILKYCSYIPLRLNAYQNQKDKNLEIKENNKGQNGSYY